jgi:thiol-disulfide isomerase/thioredoxin
MKKSVLLLLSLSILKIAIAQQYSINGHITGFANGTKFYLTDVDVNSNIDSAIIKDNEFVMKGKLEMTPKSLWLTSQSGKEFHYVTLLLNNEPINIRGDVKDFPFDLTITGSKTQDEHNEYIKLIKTNYKTRNKLVNDYFALKGDTAEVKVKGKQIWKIIAKIDSADDLIQRTYVTAHLNSYEGLFNLFFIKGKYPKDTLAKMYNSLPPEFKHSAYGQRIENYLKVGDILKKGDVMADFEALDKTGRKHRLSDIKGKYILLDFSATYCGPCVKSLTDLNNISKKYADRIDIVSFSGDGGKETWLKGVNRDKPSWLSLWDGKGNYSETILKYGITGYPTFCLIDPQGKIVERWVGYDKEPDKKGSLETDLDNFLAKK